MQTGGLLGRDVNAPRGRACGYGPSGGVLGPVGGVPPSDPSLPLGPLPSTPPRNRRPPYALHASTCYTSLSPAFPPGVADLPRLCWLRACAEDALAGGISAYLRTSSPSSPGPTSSFRPRPPPSCPPRPGRGPGWLLGLSGGGGGGVCLVDPRASTGETPDTLPRVTTAHR